MRLATEEERRQRARDEKCAARARERLCRAAECAGWLARAQDPRGRVEGDDDVLEEPVAGARAPPGPRGGAWRTLLRAQGPGEYAVKGTIGTEGGGTWGKCVYVAACLCAVRRGKRSGYQVPCEIGPRVAHRACREGVRVCVRVCVWGGGGAGPGG